MHPSYHKRKVAQALACDWSLVAQASACESLSAHTQTAVRECPTALLATKGTEKRAEQCGWRPRSRTGALAGPPAAGRQVRVFNGAMDRHAPERALRRAVYRQNIRRCAADLLRRWKPQMAVAVEHTDDWLANAKSVRDLVLEINPAYRFQAGPFVVTRDRRLAPEVVYFY
jgi:hypothetical protein